MWSICVDFLAPALMGNTKLSSCFYVCAILSGLNDQHCLAVTESLGFHTISSPSFKSHPQILPSQDLAEII